jgi:polyisoprenoid-binding protein YceI
MLNLLSKPARLVSLSLVSAAMLVAAVASAKLAKAGGGTSSFHAGGPAGMSIDGTSSDVNISDDGSTVTVTVGMNALTTGISLRDKHMKDALETDKFSSSSISVSRGSLKIPGTGAESSGDISGSMKLHGQSKNQSFHYSAKNDGGVISVTATTTVNMSDYGIKPPSYLGVTVKNEVAVTTKFVAKDN